MRLLKTRDHFFLAYQRWNLNFSAFKYDSVPQPNNTSFNLDTRRKQAFFACVRYIPTNILNYLQAQNKHGEESQEDKQKILDFSSTSDRTAAGGRRRRANKSQEKIYNDRSPAKSRSFSIPIIGVVLWKALQRGGR